MKYLIFTILFISGIAEASAQQSLLNHEMIFVDGGAFRMGSTSGDPDELPIHLVTLSSFKIGKYEVTQAQWKAVMGGNPSSYSGCEDCPVETVTWNDVQDFIRKLNAKTGKRYRLPTEAEWEYAAGGGKNSNGYAYAGSNYIGSVAWYFENNGDKTHVVGGKQANEIGIYDMCGNVWEWCSDWYGSYSNNNEKNPAGASTGQLRLARGGSWNNDAIDCRTARRGWMDSEYRDFDMGFRLVLPVE